MNPTIREDTPESDALASSEDERPWPSAPSFGSLPRKENGVPGMNGSIWATQKRGSFSMEKAAHRNAAREAFLAAPRTGLRPEGTPSPSASEGSAALTFSFPLQPTPKAGRSLSHSQGQRDPTRAPSDHAPSLSLGLLAEETDAEPDTVLGGPLTHTTSHPPMGALHRTSTLPSAYEAYYNDGHTNEPNGSTDSVEAGLLGKRFLPAFANLSLDQAQRRSQWHSHQGWEDVTTVNESRRHSLADIPTRRGSFAGDDVRGSFGGRAAPVDRRYFDWTNGAQNRAESFGGGQRFDIDTTSVSPDKARLPTIRDNAKAEHEYYRDRQDQPHDIPSMYRVPQIRLAEQERASYDNHASAAMLQAGSWGANSANRPRKQLFMVSFKCSRVDVFYLLDNTGLSIKAGDIVIVEADRGQDLGTVQHANVTPENAREYKRRYGEEQYKWLMMFSKNNKEGSVNPNAQAHDESESPSQLIANAPPTMQGLPRDNFNNLKPKAIKRLANPTEISMLSEKEGNEAKAKRACQQKVQHLRLDMEILDAEWQWDFQKLIFYYYADHYINFKDLITELYRIYKTRIWLSAINPASFSQHALGQPPSGMGPGIIGNFDPSQNNSYTMMYGQDPDPYGAVPPYRIGYDTYTPNYPGIPGVANSFAPVAMPPTGAMHPYGIPGGDVTPVMPLSATPTATHTDFGYYYNRNGDPDRTPKPFPAQSMYAHPNAPANVYNPMYAPNVGAAVPPLGGTADRGFGYNYQQIYGGGLGLNGNAGGFARQGALPSPIGTRPHSNGNTTHAPTSMPAPYGTADAPARSGAHATSLQAGSMMNRKAPDFVPGPPTQQQVTSVANGPYGNASGGSHSSKWAGLSASGSMGQGEKVRSYLDGLQARDA